MTNQSKYELLKHYRGDYRKGGKSEKTRIIDCIAEVAGYSRKHIIRAFNGGVRVPKKIRRNRSSRYAYIRDVLCIIWASANFICGKRLKPLMPDLIKSLKRHKEIRINKEEEVLLLAVSASTIDRLLAPARKQMSLKGRSTTKPGTLLKHQIPVRTFAEWSGDHPGFLEIDLVAHCGDSTRGEYLNTLNMTDVATGWTVCVAFMGRSERFCVDAIEGAKGSFPFQILGIDSDNGSEFINAHLTRYCERNSITFTRGRPYRKNDQCRIEQKNWDVVRKMVGYARFDNYEQLAILNRVHNLLSIYQNYFQPSQKLISKERVGARVRKTYDIAQTPAQRLLARSDLPRETNKLLKNTFLQINPAQLLRTIQDLIHELHNQ